MSRVNSLLRWEGRVGHPRQFVSRLNALLEDQGYDITDHGLRQKQAAIRDAAEYEGAVYGNREVGGIALIQLIFGLALAIVLIGFWLIRDALRRPVLEIWVTFEGEEYYASAIDNIESVRSHERVGTISDLRITVRQILTWPEWRIKKTHSETIEEVEYLIQDLERNLDTLLPSLEIGTRPANRSATALTDGDQV